MNKRISIFVEDTDDSFHFNWVKAWLEKWGVAVAIDEYSTGGWEHYWVIEAPEEAVVEVPEEYLCVSKWSAPEVFGK